MPVAQRHEDVVVDLGAGSAAVDLRVHAAGGPEQLDRLVDQVAPEIEEQPARFLRITAFAPRAPAAAPAAIG